MCETPPTPRYRARLIATNLQDDLALLRIYQEENTGRMVRRDTLDLPWLPISNDIPSSETLRLMGYPPSGGNAISYPTFDQSGFADGDKLLKIQATVSKGFSGGPATVINIIHFRNENCPFFIRKNVCMGW